MYAIANSSNSRSPPSAGKVNLLRLPPYNMLVDRIALYKSSSLIKRLFLNMLASNPALRCNLMQAPNHLFASFVRSRPNDLHVYSLSLTRIFAKPYTYIRSGLHVYTLRLTRIFAQGVAYICALSIVYMCSNRCHFMSFVLYIDFLVFDSQVI